MNGLNMLLLMALFFGAMYLYCWLPEYLGPIKEKRKEERKAKIEKEKEDFRKKRRAAIEKNIEENRKTIKVRHAQIKEHYKWLDDLNLQINKHTSKK